LHPLGQLNPALHSAELIHRAGYRSDGALAALLERYSHSVLVGEQGLAAIGKLATRALLTPQLEALGDAGLCRALVELAAVDPDTRRERALLMQSWATAMLCRANKNAVRCDHCFRRHITARSLRPLTS
jgi:hypothetical protein